MRKEAIALTLLLACAAALSGCGTDGRSTLDLRLRAKADSLNKAAFMQRYNDPHASIEASVGALRLIGDSLPQYVDGRLRAFNNLAFAHYMLADYGASSAWVDSVFDITEAANRTLRPANRALHGCKNAEVENVIAQLMRIRLLQRSCQIAESYQLLYNIDQSEVLEGDPENYLYSYALMEYYITSLTLNYQYRNSAVASSSATALTAETKASLIGLIDEVAEALPGFKCDYAEVMSVNYAMAHSCYRLAAASGGDPALLAKAYAFLSDNLRILSIPGQFNVYHLANVFQLQAFIAADTNIAPEARFVRCAAELKRIDSLTAKVYPAGQPAAGAADCGIELFRTATGLFFRTSDPYQHLGAVVAAAEYCLQIGRVEEAHRYYALALADSSWHDGMAPKFESMLYDGLIRSGYSTRPGDNARWYGRQMELVRYIRENEREDVLLQDRLNQSENRNRFYAAAMGVSAAFLVALAVLVVLLRRRSKVLRQEKNALQEAKRKDVERIANVETCLSVLRHDVNPFLTYLQNKKLSEPMRNEVIEQLIRTFANLKQWTTLTLPAGVQFSPSAFGLGEVFESVAASCANFRGPAVTLCFSPTPLRLSGDKQLVEIMLRNLVNNALQHTERGRVDVAAAPFDQDPRFAHITITDTGCGMDEDTIDNLFRADKTVRPDTDPAAPHGTGFGLILCKYIIKRHDDNTLRGCRIWAQSAPGRGSAFHLLLAVAPPPDGSAG